ncbi:helix-turn-helix domain-containing protein, partial [Chloroflexota bacterium]
MTMVGKMMGIKEFARAAHYSERQIRQYCLDGKIKGAMKLSGSARKWLIPASALQKLAEKNSHSPQKEIDHSSASEIKSVKIKRIKQNILKNMVRLRTGEEIVNLVSNIYALYSNHDHLENEEQMQVISEFFQTIQDFLDTTSDFGPSYHVEMAFEMTKRLTKL